MALDTKGAYGASAAEDRAKSWFVTADMRVLPGADELAFADLAQYLSDYCPQIGRTGAERVVTAVVVTAGSKEEAEAFVRGLLALYQEATRWWHSLSLEVWLELPAL